MVEYLRLDGDGPRLVAHECQGCGALFFERRNACGQCGRDRFAPKTLARTGVITSFTVVSRSAPGVDVPFVSVVVALDGGGWVKSTLRDAPDDPAEIPPRLPVELVTYSAGADCEGTEAVIFAFRPQAHTISTTPSSATEEATASA
jgi:uncharacterized OB-fold protein